MAVLDDLEPREVWKWFEEVLRIPRPSGEEERIADFIANYATERGLQWRRDELNNVLVRKNGSGDAAGHPSIALQAHVDIVPEKTENSDHDHSKDPIIPVIQDGWVTSPETTLGADNGIGVALMLAVLDSDSIQHPPLECLFTTDEERGLTGAAGLDPSWISSRRLINLDSEDEACFVIGCAGGKDVHLEIPVEASGSSECFSLEISGLKGGHSGMEINAQRGNAIRFIGRMLTALVEKLDCRLAMLEGGTKRNAIPRSCRAVLSLPREGIDAVKELANRIRQDLEVEYSGIEDSIRFELAPVSDVLPTVSNEFSAKAAALLLALPHGVEKMSGRNDELVETSINLATAEMSTETFRISLSIRSPIASARDALYSRVSAVAELAGGTVYSSGDYPGWLPNYDSPMLKKMMEIYKDLYGREPFVEAIHAGLECGIIGDRTGGMDMISIGPDIRDVHIPGEKVNIESVGTFWKFFVRLLAKLD
ncbi:MAG: beta-Ala-His dipeptidase [Candidatus Aegiribacteria sp.]|nr:beta-Ala-His dipeptidase [Candidatus Aegiribacteria sp.]MBD3295342.1 beta-Ala-His dipeptidase [Candidatus Fermentibacteria bacterium]